MKFKHLFVLLPLLSTTLAAQSQERALRKLEVHAEPGFLFGVSKNETNFFTATAGVGTWLDGHFYLGIHGGAWIPTEKEIKTVYPLFLRSEYKFNKSTISGFSLQMDLGYVFRGNDAFLLGVMPTYSLPLNTWSNLKFAFGYNATFVKGGTGHFLGARIGWELNCNAKRRRFPVRNSGLQYTIEGGLTTVGDYDEGGKQSHPIIGVALTYKYDPHISFGAVFDIDDRPNIALRGQYRLNDKKASPIAAADLGIKMLEEGTSPYISPAIGYSIRCVNNSYFDFKVGYKIGKTVKETDAATTEHKIKNNGFFLTIGWTHTMKFLARN